GQADLGAAVHAGRHGQGDGALAAVLPAPATRPAGLARDLAAAVARRARPVDGEAALPEGDPAGASALAARDRARARGVPRARAHGAVLVDRDADRRLRAARGQEEIDLARQLDVAATLNTGAAPAPAAAEVEERAEQVADPAEVAEVVDGEAEAARAA